MKRLLTAAQMKKCDSYTINTVGVPSRELMQRAAESAFREIMNGGFDLTRVLCVCGTGNNGGDGLAVAMLLSDAGVCVEYYVSGDADRMTEECRYRYDELVVKNVPEQRELDLEGVTLVVDALLGIGIEGEVRDNVARVIEAINESKAPVVALDIPSGISSDTGAEMGCAVRAVLTVSFARMKPGHLFYPGRLYCGKTVIAHIGIGEEGVSGDPLVINTAEGKDIYDLLPKRYPDSHKGTFGRLLIAAGSVGMCGAAYLSALGAYRSGVGIVEVFTPVENVPIIQTRLPEAIATGWRDQPASHLRARSSAASACVIGPGLGKGANAVRLVEEALYSKLPLVIDADGLNIIAENEDLKSILRSRRKETVITPHLGEMSRLCGVAIADIAEAPIRIAREFSKEYGVVCVLKDCVTVIAREDSVFVNSTGCSALAKGGSGDVLSGVIGAFLASGCDALPAALSGVYLHGLAGRLAAEEMSEYSVLASDTADHMGKAILKVQKQN